MAPAEERPSAVSDDASLSVDDADGRTNAIGGRSGRESRLDLVLAEELAVNHSFLLWFLGEAVTWREGGRPSLPDHPTLHAEVRLNVFEDTPPIPPEAHGETDIALTLTWKDGQSLPVVIEDKIWSPFQPRQPERCVGRAEHHKGVAVLVAPASYIESHKAKAQIFHGRVSVEKMIDRLRSREAHEATDATSERRRQWRAQLLTELIQRPPPTPPDPLTVAFTEFCVDWFQKHALAVIPSRSSLRNTGQGWLWFEIPRGLGYKASGWSGKLRAGVDLYVKDHGFTGTAEELDTMLQEVGHPDGFTRTADTVKNLVLRFACAKVDPDAGRPEPGSTREKDVVEALEACQRVAEWLHRNQERLATAPKSGR
jgi:hypothetical protein